ncbi:DUF7742 family protein [Ketogulonicigenium vulgare]|uniref:DUF7742 domain-containing protein n=1 Tax=Ketogulonicigenium vulgare (strain WSH-001) TaxID=759362 RepID=F9Y468_KETVW|nr:hypothetical protein [Ketogulonicigenium vulgare]ADO42310.1 hypothetical protein EIO_1165 [Ketogulonicigenium vulgare Y25]AEM40504.1 hypothetical protein KVU_0665 [Ketogulonicigenium vulgare WSH-001]ALJ80689.1 hypothetical protein KVH_05540 [Ketogulonicigenium vulgare]ANW33496.1 hypothetical protein KvSKV_05510 [Ketogulonicigenium vulgare]AOZ54221.1 hypothetical protein KVC_1204 [Ketogulonicigenium vulgare]
MLHLGDLDLAARWLMDRPRGDWGRALGELDWRCTAARAHVAATGRIHPDFGDGSVMAAILCETLRPGYAVTGVEREYLLALGTAAFHFSQNLPMQKQKPVPAGPHGASSSPYC